MRVEYPSYRTQIDTYQGGLYTWTQPPDAAFIHVTCIGAGGGGGSGARGAAGTYRGGGQGGQGGSYNTAFLPAALVAATVDVVVGVSGGGGIAISYDDGYGDNGFVGGLTRFGEYVLAMGGNRGLGGTDAPFDVATLPKNYAFVQSLYARTFGGVNGEPAESSVGCPGGGSGGYITAADAPQIGARGSRSYGSGPVQDPDILPGQNGKDSTGLVPAPGSSGAGGSPPGASTDFDPPPEGWVVNGGRGGRYGSGGGGGGATVNGTDSGAGGNGASGICVVVTFF